jgi:osmotically-inducible protein OsmY
MNKLKRKLEHTLLNNWSTGNQRIQVNVSGHKVELHGIVDSLYQKDAAERLAWYASDVWSVDNELVVDFSNVQTS